MRFIPSHLAVFTNSVFGFGVAGLLLLLTTAPHTAQAQTTSQIARVKLPRGAESYSGITSLYKTLLTEVAQVRPLSFTPKGSNPEVFIWKEANYREDRVSLIKGAFASALEAAGYTTTEPSLNDIAGVNIFNIFTEEVKAPFNPSVAKQSTYLVAQNNVKKQTFVAAWLESGNALTLGILRVEFKAPHTTAKWSAPTGNTVLIKNWKNASAGLPSAPMPAFPALARKAGVAKGWLKDAAGRPIANAEVVAESSFGGGLRTYHKARSNAQGLYQILIPRGVARVISAEVKKTYNGEIFALPLVPVRGEAQQFNSTQGQVENFVLRTRGDNYGGVIRLYGSVPDKSALEVTLAPVGPQLDGSAGKTFIYRFTGSEFLEQYIGGLPIGRYKLSLRMDDEGDILPVRVALPSGTDEERVYRSSVTVNFKSGFTRSEVIQSNFGLQHFEVLVKP